MIIQFKDSNYGPFKKGFRLSFVSTEAEDRRKEPSVSRPYGKGPEPLRFPLKDTEHGVLPLVGVWGANDVGKSCLIQTLRDLAHIARGGEVGDLSFPNRKRSISIAFTGEEASTDQEDVFEYKVTFTKGRIVAEYLLKGSKPLFVRATDDKHGKFARTWKGDRDPSPKCSVLSTDPDIAGILLRSYRIPMHSPYFPGLWKPSEAHRKLFSELGNRAGFDTSTWGPIFDGTAEEVPRSVWSFLCLASDIYHALINGHLLVVDDLDAVLHTDVCAELIRCFTEESNKKRAQLLFIAKSPELMDYLRKDETYFVEKKTHAGAANLYSAACFKLTEESKKRKTSTLYAEGRFGGLPWVWSLPRVLEQWVP